MILRASPSISAASRSWLATHLSAFLPPLAALVVSNLARSRPRTVLAALSLFLSSVLLVLMASGLLAFRESLQGTLLGDFILLQTAVPQLAGCAFALLLSFLSVADLLLLQVRERQQEIGLLQALGWRPALVQRLFVQEGILLALVGALPGVLVALNILEREQIAQHLIPPLLLALSVGLLMLLVAALASIPALRAISRLQLIQVLRAE